MVTAMEKNAQIMLKFAEVYYAGLLYIINSLDNINSMLHRQLDYSSVLHFCLSP